MKGLFRQIVLSGFVMLLLGCSSGSPVQNPINPVGPTPVPGASKVFVERSSYFVGSSVTYDGALLQFAGSSSGTTSPVVNAPITNQLLRGLAVDSSGDLFVAGTQFGYTPGGYVQITNAFVQVYAPGYTSTSTPIRTVNLPNADPAEEIAVDGTGQLYVLSSQSGTVYVFAAGATGNAIPVRTITGANTMLGTGETRSIAVDASGQIYVGNFTPAQVLIFAAGANGNVSPARTLSITAGGVWGVAVDSTSNLYVVANDTTGTTSSQLQSKGSILQFAPGATTPSAAIQGSATTLFYGGCLQVDAAGNIWLVNLTQTTAVVQNQSVLEFAAGSSGNAAPLKTFTSGVWEPSAQPSIAVQ